MYEFQCDYEKKIKYGEKGKLCHMDTHSFTVYIKTHYLYKGLQKMLKLNLILQIMNWINLCKREEIKE